MERLLKNIDYVSVIFLAFAGALFVSSVISYRISNLPNFNFSNVRCGSKEQQLNLYVEREGFFKPKVKTVNRVEKPSEETFSINDYSLKGTVVCSQCNHSIAILKKGNSTKIVSVGEEIDGFKVKQIYPDRVVFSRNGREIVLLIKGRKTEKNSVAGISQSERRFTVSRREILRQISSGEFLKYINIVPNSNPPGLKVNYVNTRSFIYKLGIRPGDVIVSINDIRIRTPEDSFAAFEKLKNSDSVTIEVLRRGKRVKLHYEIE